MRVMTATEASRGFKDLLDAVERGESVVITRGNHPVAEIRPAGRRTGRDLAAVMSDEPRLDVGFTDDLDAALALLTEPTDLWRDA